MIRYFLLAAAAGLLAGCGTDTHQPAANGEIPAQGAATPDGIHCSAVARERANDALTNGYGFQIEESVFQEAYQDCMAWRARRPG
jgi:hypothetical protein